MLQLNLIYNAKSLSFQLIKDYYFCTQCKKHTMDIKIILHGKTEEAYLQEGISKYIQRIKRYITFSELVIAPPKNSKSLNFHDIKIKEGELLLAKIKPTDMLILLDDKGTILDSVDFSEFLQKKMNQGVKNLVFVVGGSYGFSKEVYERANFKLSLSKMTFSHQIIRLLFVEQLYRAFTILNHEPYHHE